MICPVCGHNNLQGNDQCENCGSDLRTSDIPRPSTDFEERLVAEPLATLSAPGAVTLPPSTDIAEAVGRMQRDGNGCLVVEDGERVVGVFTERDALLKLAGRKTDGTSLGELMTPEPVVLRPDDSIATAIHLMADGGFRHIPLVSEGRAVGVVSARDIFRYILEVID